jgi:Outer membrane lipoprotein-sorting protein
LVKKIYILFFLQIFLLNLKNVCADDKIKVINNLNNIETLKFNFIQETFDKNEKGVCFMMRPHFLKCNYEDKIQKELIINRNNLVIYHRRYNKSYYYPVSKSFFTDILNKEKFKNMILNGNFFFYTNVLE